MKSLIPLAQTLAKTSHEGQKYGIEDYFDYHITGVVNSLLLHSLPETYIIVGYLHDAVEDTELSLETINNLFGYVVKDAVDAISKRPGEPRIQYLQRCSSNKIARIVKLHDAMFNATNCFKNKNKHKFNEYLEAIGQLSHI